jgi:hypothetical protein
MNKDPRDVTLDRIQQIANLLLGDDGLPESVRLGLERVEALARHRDNPSVVQTLEGEEEGSD